MTDTIDPAGTARLLDAVTAAQRLHETIEHAAMVLAYTGHYRLAQRLTADWAAYGTDVDGEDLALPSPTGLGPVAPALATGAAVILGALTLAGAVVGRVRLAVGRSRRG